jgi:hypothetical protein
MSNLSIRAQEDETMTRPIVILALIALAVTSLVSAADPPERMNYQGVLRNSADVPLDGSFPMAFRFFDALTAGNEILVDAHGAVTVSGGLFNVQLGSGSVTDGSGPGTFATLTAVFAEHAELYLEVEVDGETLSPRTPVAAAGYALNARKVRGKELVSDGPLELYVDNSVTGCGGAGCSDSNDGLSPETAKQTIQAAVNAIPVVLNGTVTVYIATGTYAEEVFVSDRTRTGLFPIILAGSGRNNVTLQGSGSGVGIIATDLRVVVAAMTIDNYEGGLVALGGGYLNLVACRISNHTDRGVNATQGSFVEIEDCEFDGNPTGIEAQDHGTIEIFGDSEPVSFVSNTTPVKAVRNGYVYFSNSSNCEFIGGGGMFADGYSTVAGYGACTNAPSCNPGPLNPPTGSCRP